MKFSLYIGNLLNQNIPKIHYGEVTSIRSSIIINNYYFQSYFHYKFDYSDMNRIVMTIFAVQLYAYFYYKLFYSDMNNVNFVRANLRNVLVGT